MVRLTVRLSEADQFAVELPAATTTAGAAARTLARLHNQRLTIAGLRAEAGAATRAAAESGEAAATTGEQPPNATNTSAQLDDALGDLYDAAALRGSKAASSSSPPFVSARDVAAKLTAVAIAASSLPLPGGAAALLRAIEQAEAEAAKAVRESEMMDLGCEQQEEEDEEESASAAGRLPPRAAACWFAGRALQPADATLAKLLGGGCAVKADRTRAVVLLTRGVESGAPVKSGALVDGDGGGEGGGRSNSGGPDAETRRAMLAWCLKRQEQLARLDEAARDGEDDHCDAPWADPSALRRELTGVAGGVRWRC
jgi:hypothetical protein